MNVRSLVWATGVGAAAFVLVTVAVTELLASTIAFSLLVGLPVGVAAGLLAAVVVVRARASPNPQAHRGATALGWFAGGFLLVLVVAVAAGVRPTVALVSSVALGVVIGVLGWVLVEA